jgi:hypothetical protein
MGSSFSRLLRRHGWLVGVVGAVLVLTGLAFYSPDRQKSLTEFEAVGPTSRVQTSDVAAIQVQAGSRQWNIERVGGGNDSGWKTVNEGAKLDTATNEAIELGLRLLHNSPPERSFDTEAVEFGLTPPPLSITLTTRSGIRFEVDMGRANPTGMARYVRIRERNQSALHLMAGYVIEPWELVARKLP